MNQFFARAFLHIFFTLADAIKLSRKLRLSKDFNWVDCVESILKDSTQSAQLKSFESLNFSCNFVASASVKIDVSKFNKIYEIDHLFKKIV